MQQSSRQSDSTGLSLSHETFLCLQWARGLRASSGLWASHQPSSIPQREMSQALSSATLVAGECSRSTIPNEQSGTVRRGALVQVMKSKSSG